MNLLTRHDDGLEHWQADRDWLDRLDGHGRLFLVIAPAVNVA
jgi:hypothetical protein